MSKDKAMRAGGKDILSKMQVLQNQLLKAQENLAGEMVEASAGGGAITIKMSGTQQCHAVTIDPELLRTGDVEMLQDLILLAVNQAIHDSQVLAARNLGPLAGGLGSLG
jgi:DNA-binding YbaB/EbfC family protein